MSSSIGNKGLTAKLTRFLNNAQSDIQDSTEKLSSGQVFTSLDPRPAERSISDNLEFKLRGLSASKKALNEGVSLLQTAEGGMSEINNILSRMKEINIAAATSTLDDRERRFLFVEYEALYDEINRIATTTEYNGLTLLNGTKSEGPDELALRVGVPYYDPDSGEDLNLIRFDQLSHISATTEFLGVKSARSLLESTTIDDGITVDEAQDLLSPDGDSGEFATTYDRALAILSEERAVFGALQTRLQKGSDYIDVYQENLAAAKSKISDTDYASEIARMAEANMLFKATSSLMAHANINTQISLNLLQSVI